MSRTVVVLGAGTGGLTTAGLLREMLDPDDRIVVVDRCLKAAQGLSLLWIMRGWRSSDQVMHTPDRLNSLDVEVIESEVGCIDLAGRNVVTAAGEVSYDALVIALGAELRPQGLVGFPEAVSVGRAGEFYTMDGALAVHDQLSQFSGGRLAFVVAGMPFKCPAAPYEGALLAADLLAERGVRSDVQIDFYTPEPLPMPVAGPVVGKRLAALLAERNIEYHPSTPIERVDPAGELRFVDGSRAAFDYLIAIPPHGAPRPVSEAGFSEAGWIPVDARTLTTAAEGVWALGDVALVTLANGKPLPKAAVFARGQAAAVATGVAAYLGIDIEPTEFNGDGYCYVETGGGLAAKGAGNFYTEPAPTVTLTEPSAASHSEKEEEEIGWISRWSGTDV
ncbi:FAD/NAD(P)-binding oxidoreductase [Nocardia sp. NPDC046473]|uniref:NAD(P)/FAD-dependent oxidoreductase n=1 Tax=Nocardia sp. NPDC046473 TaxID=3155733 RepID=UPI0033FBA659